MATEDEIRSALDALPEEQWPEEFLKSTEHYDVSPQGEIKRDWIEEAAQGYGYQPYLVGINTPPGPWPRRPQGYTDTTVAVLAKNADDALETADEWTCTKYYESLHQACQAGKERGEGVVSVQSLLDVRAENPSTMGSDDFVEAVRAKADLGDGYWAATTRRRPGSRGISQSALTYDTATLTFVNMPPDLVPGMLVSHASAVLGGPSDQYYANRLRMLVTGFGQGENEPPPTGKVKFRFADSALLRGSETKRPPRKTSSPERMVDYVAAIITEAAKLPSKLPPGSSRAANPAPVSASDLARKLKF